jgi:hypothetical protein
MSLPGILMLIVLLLGGLAIAGLTKRGWLRFTGLAAVVIVIAIAGFFLRHFNRRDRGFGQIHVGDSREGVLQIMGAPTEDTDATIGIYGSKRLATDRVQDCTEQYWYYPFFTPECWWIASDAQGHDMATNHFISL